MQALKDFIVPLLWLVPLIIAVVNYIRENTPSALPSWSLAPIAVCVAMMAIVATVYFPQMPIVLKALVAALALGGTAVGVFDITKLFGTTYTGPTPIVVSKDPG